MHSETTDLQEGQMEANKNSILDENGRLRIGALSEGLFTLRFTQDGDTIILSWVPDEGEPVEKRIPIKDGDERTEGYREYVECLVENADKGIEAVFICIPKLAE